MTDINSDAPAKRKGWPKGKPRGPRATPPLQAPIQEPVRQARRQLEYTPEGRVIAIGANGERLTRKRTATSDIFHIPPEIIPSGYDYQWNVLEIVGQPAVAQRLAMAENGWRPVPAGRHPGRYMATDYPPSSPIIREGLILEERPMVLTEEARAEELAKAMRQDTDQKEQLGLVRKLPEGFNRENPMLKRYERTGTSRRIAPAPDAPRPQLAIDPDAA